METVMADHVATVATIYEAFGSGDVDTFLEHLADDVEWEAGIRDTGLGYFRERHGKAEVAGFFSALMENVELTHFEPLALCDADDFVAVPVRHAGRLIGGGEVPMTTEVHLWRFGPDGKVVSFEHVLDLAVHERAAAVRSEPLAGRTLRVLEDRVRVDVAGGQLEIFELSGPADSGPPPHAHPWDEAYIGLDGEVEVTMGDSPRTLLPGDVVCIPAGVMHSFRIVSGTARFRLVTSGHRASAFFADMHANTPADVPMADALPDVIEVARRNGLSSPLFT